jgi:hypothetical protein
MRPLTEIREVRVRVRGSEEGEVRVRILELSATTGSYSDSLITSL